MTNENNLTLLSYISSLYNNLPSINNAKFSDYVRRMYPIILELKDSNDAVNSALQHEVHRH